MPLRAPLNTIVLAGHIFFFFFAVLMVISCTCETEVMVTFLFLDSHVTWTQLGVSLCLAPASRKVVLTSFQVCVSAVCSPQRSVYIAVRTCAMILDVDSKVTCLSTWFDPS